MVPTSNVAGNWEPAFTPQPPLPATFNDLKVLTLVSSINASALLHPQCCFPNLGRHHSVSELLQQPLPSIIFPLCSTSDIFKNMKPIMICHGLNPSTFSPVLSGKKSKVLNIV